MTRQDLHLIQNLVCNKLMKISCIMMSLTMFFFTWLGGWKYCFASQNEYGQRCWLLFIVYFKQSIVTVNNSKCYNLMAIDAWLHTAMNDTLVKTVHCGSEKSSTFSWNRFVRKNVTCLGFSKLTSLRWVTHISSK